MRECAFVFCVPFAGLRPKTASMWRDVELQLKSDPWELELIILDASVRWELTAWPLMDMANVAVNHLVAGPHSVRGGRNLTLQIYGAHHRFIYPAGFRHGFQRSLHYLLIFYRRNLLFDRKVPRYSHLGPPGHTSVKKCWSVLMSSQNSMSACRDSFSPPCL